MTEIRIYVEGGGQGKDSRREIRGGFSQFLGPLCDLARTRRIQWDVIICGPRNAAFRDFTFALESHPEAFNILLVDSEEGVSRGRWEHVRRRDGWEVPNLPEEHCHFMVCTVEAWLAADPEALANYYGQGFRRNVLPTRKDIESVEKEALMAALNRATEGTKKGRYQKIRHCADLLGMLDQGRVRARAHHCDLLFRALEARITGTAEAASGV